MGWPRGLHIFRARLWAASVLTFSILCIIYLLPPPGDNLQSTIFLIHQIEWRGTLSPNQKNAQFATVRATLRLSAKAQRSIATLTPLPTLHASAITPSTTAQILSALAAQDFFNLIKTLLP
jgi:hypothetical protein